MSNTRVNEFLQSLYGEKLKDKEHRHIFVVQKLLFIIGLFSLGLIQYEVTGNVVVEAIEGATNLAGKEALESATNEGTRSLAKINTGLLVYLIPFVALAYDTFIFAADFKVKRIGLFIRLQKAHSGTVDSTNISPTGSVCREEIAWEKWVSNNREPLASTASLVLTVITVISSFALIFIISKNEGIAISFLRYDSHFYWSWVGVSLLGICFIFYYYRLLRVKLNVSLNHFAPLSIDAAQEQALNSETFTDELEKELRNHFYVIQGVPTIIKEAVLYADNKIYEVRLNERQNWLGSVVKELKYRQIKRRRKWRISNYSWRVTKAKIAESEDFETIFNSLEDKFKKHTGSKPDKVKVMKLWRISSAGSRSRLFILKLNNELLLSTSHGLPNLLQASINN